MTVCSLDMPVSFPLPLGETAFICCPCGSLSLWFNAFSHIPLCPTAPAHEQKSVHNSACPTRLLPCLRSSNGSSWPLPSPPMVRKSLFVWLHLPLHTHLWCLFSLCGISEAAMISQTTAFSVGPSSGMSTSYSPSRKRLAHIDYWWFFNHCSWVSLLCCFSCWHFGLG